MVSFCPERVKVAPTEEKCYYWLLLSYGSQRLNADGTRTEATIITINSKYPKQTSKMTTPPSSGWVWNADSESLEFMGFAAEGGSLSDKRGQARDNMKDLQLRSEWLADVCIWKHRGRHSSKKSLSAAHLNAYRASVLQKQGDHVTIDDVKQVAVALLQEHYSLPIPLCFMALLNLEINTDHQKMAKTLAKKEIAQKILAVHYFGMIMDTDMARHTQHSHTAYHKGRIAGNRNEWLLHACLYSFFCCVAWVAFGRRHMTSIQEEVGRLLYSDTFNMAVRKKTEDASSFANDGSAIVDGTKSERSACYQRMFQRRPGLSNVFNQRSPLMVCLLPTPKEQSPHLFSGRRAARLSPVQTENYDNEVLTEEVHQQLASVRFGIMGRPLNEFNPSTLLCNGEEENNIDLDDKPENHTNNGTTNN
ncbi:protein phosphatase 1 regulatory subunit 36 isoform X2 [Dunckerocampus dactyliophorus]|uniref:protein phosphatase 1 regulatory subunit 36 isoform X2 n=1 Tax=Dunckerocampus dactyliophorus TaxID=161453 RepID=UPI002405242F|nr:protein phosphatase 1 regulatory subunit 36 isoform X2 [Dunckerocampus dactyliophorus]